MKRLVSSESEELSNHLSSVRQCLLCLKECAHSYALENTAEDQEQCSAAIAHSCSRLMRCCLYMYNALEAGLNYMDDPGRNVPEVEMTMECTDSIVHALLSSCAPLMATSEGAAVREQLGMLRNTLNALYEEMLFPGPRGEGGRGAVVNSRSCDGKKQRGFF